MIEEDKYNIYKTFFPALSKFKLFKPRIIQVNVKVPDTEDDYIRHIIRAWP